MPRPPVVAIAPIEEIEVDVTALVAPAVAEAFGVRSSMPARSRCRPRPRIARGQYLSTAFLDVLARARRPDWERLLGVTGVGLYVPRPNFVFGEADARGGVAAFSVHRLRGGDAALFARWSATEAVHELGHTYGLGHRRRRDCAMWISNMLWETDRKGTALCPEHAAQIRRVRGR